jgi:hypothetical protein
MEKVIQKAKYIQYIGVLQYSIMKRYYGLIATDGSSYFQGYSGSVANIMLQFVSENHNGVYGGGGLLDHWISTELYLINYRTMKRGKDNVVLVGWPDFALFLL